MFLYQKFPKDIFISRWKQTLRCEYAYKIWNIEFLLIQLLISHPTD